jgi:RNA polymerase sigma factor (sigma-70 family)
VSHPSFLTVPAQTDLSGEIERLYTERYRSYLRLALSVTRNDGTAHDAVQEGFARALARQDELRSAEVLEAWICRIIIRCAIDSQRDAARVPTELPHDVALVWSPELPHPHRDPELTGALRALPSRQRAMVFLRYFADLPLATIAAICETRLGTVSATLAQAKDSLAVRLALDDHRKEVTTSDR